jgi:Zn-dependent protease with chaperone function
MPFLLLLILALAYLQTRWPRPPAELSAAGSALVTWLGVAVLGGAAWLLVWRLRRRLARQPEQCSRLLRRHFAWQRVHALGVLVFYFLAAYLIGWGWTVKYHLTWNGWPLPGAELLILTPFLASLVLSWAIFHEVENAVHELFGPKESPPTALARSRWAHVGLQARQSLVLAAPPFLLLVIQQVLFGIFPGLQNDPLWMPLLSMALLAVLFISWPWLLRLLLNLRPMPNCPLRQRLEATARRLKFRCSDILVWDTHNNIATALLAGPLPALRYVVFTDRLIGQLEPEEVEAVFAHEVGHIKHRHMLLYLLFLIVSLLVLAAAGHAVLELAPLADVERWVAAYAPWPDFWTANRDLLLAVPLLVVLLAYLFVVFGFLSRRCERQADLYACRATSAPAFIAALEKVARLSGISRSRPGRLASWRHGTVAARVDCLRRLQADPGLELRYRLDIGLAQWGLLAGLGCVLLLLGPGRLWELFRPS